MAAVLFEERIAIPDGIATLADFRRWAQSKTFPQTGRIDYIAGQIEVDMSGEDLFCHGTVKSEIIAVISAIVKQLQLGNVWVDSARMSSPLADLSAEPDIVFVSWRSLKTGRVRLVPHKRRKGRYIELEGAPDLVVEIISDTSVKKDTKRLPPAYFAAGVREFWLVDARGDDLAFHIHRRGKTRFRPVAAAADGSQASAVLVARVRLGRERGPMDLWQYTLDLATTEPSET